MESPTVAEGPRMEHEKVKLECVVLAESFETAWAYYQQSSGHLLSEECKTEVKHFIEAFEELTAFEPNLKADVAARAKLKETAEIDAIVSELGRWANGPQKFPYGNISRLHLTLWTFITALKAILLLEFGIERSPQWTMNCGEALYSRDFVKWRSHFPRVVLWKDPGPDELLHPAWLTDTLV